MASTSYDRLLVSHPEHLRHPALLSAAMPVLGDYSPKMESGDAAGVRTLIPSLEGQAEQAIRALEFASRVHRHRLEDIRTAGRRRREILTQAARSFQALSPADQETAHQALVANLGKDQADSIVAVLREPRGRQSTAAMSRVQAAEREAVARLAVTLFVAAARGNYYSVFADSRARTTAQPVERQEAGASRGAAQLSKYASELRESLIATARSVHEQLAADPSAADVADLARSTLHALGSHLTWAAAVLGSQSAVAAKNPAILPPSLEIFTCARSAVALYTYSAHLLTLAVQHWSDEEPCATEVAAAKRLTFESARPLGEPLRSGDVSSHAGTDRLIRLTGIVRNVRVVDDPTPQKYSTIFEVEDDAGSATVRAHRFRLTANGLADGAYCEAHGRVSADNGGGPPVVNLDRLPLTEQAETSWVDYVTVKGRPFYEAFPNEFNFDYLAATA